MESRAKYATIILCLMCSSLQCSRYAVYTLNTNYGFRLPTNWNNNVTTYFYCASKCLGQARCTSFFFRDDLSSCILDIDTTIISPSKNDTAAWACYYRSRSLINVALNKPVNMSSLWNQPIYYSGSFATDGLFLKTPYGFQCAHTDREVSPWLKIDLGKSYEIDRVILHNRQDEAGERLHDVEITAGLDDLLFPYYCGGFIGASETGQTVQVICKASFQARHLRIQIIGKSGEGNYLTLCEVEVLVFSN